MGDFVSFNPTANLKGVYGDFSIPQYTEETQTNQFDSIFFDTTSKSENNISKLYGAEDIDISKYSDGISFEKNDSLTSVMTKTKDFFSEGFSAGVNLFNLEKSKQNATARNDFTNEQFGETTEVTLADCTRFYLAYNTTF